MPNNLRSIKKLLIDTNHPLRPSLYSYIVNRVYEHKLEKQSMLEKQQLEEKCAHQAANQPYDATLSPEEKTLLNQINSGNTLVKLVVGPNRSSRPCWEKTSIYQMLQNYNHRPNLREPYRFSNDIPYYRYVHMTDEILCCEPLIHKEQKERYHSHSHTKKNSTTYISETLITPLFRPGVALAFDVKQCRIDALFNKDADTYTRPWVSPNRIDVVNYRNTLHGQHIGRPHFGYQSFSNFDAFKEKMKKNYKFHNEVLARVNRAATTGLVLYNRRQYKRHNVLRKPFSGCYKHCRVAEKGNNAMHRILGKNLPMSLYDNAYRTCRIYTSDEQELQKLKSKLKRCPLSNVENIKIGGLFIGTIAHHNIKPILHLINSLEETLNNPKTKDLYQQDKENNKLVYNHALARIYIERTKSLIQARFTPPGQKQVLKFAA